MKIGPNIVAEIDALRLTTEFTNGRRIGKILHQFGTCRVTVIGMPANSYWTKHQAKGPVMVQVIRGRVKFTVGDEAFQAGPHSVIFLEAAEPHDVFAVEESFLLLTVDLSDASS